jgi:hypothetical protein
MGQPPKKSSSGKSDQPARLTRSRSHLCSFRRGKVATLNVAYMRNGLHRCLGPSHSHTEAVRQRMTKFSKSHRSLAISSADYYSAGK